MRKVNPFKPTAGAEPPVLAGRDAVLEDFEIGLEEGVGAPGRLMRITGPRGSGKTVLLTELGDIARQHGWRVVDVTAAGHLPELICRRLEKEKRADYSVELDLKVIKARAQKDDSLKTEDIYEVLERVVGKLTEKGYRVFFARITLEDKLGTEYEPYIFAALNSAKIMLVFGTDYPIMDPQDEIDAFQRRTRFTDSELDELLMNGSAMLFG